MNPALLTAMSNPKVVDAGINASGKILKWTGIGVGCLIAYLIGRRIYKSWKAGEPARELEKSINQITDNGDATISSGEAAVVAASLYSAMEDCGTDETTIRTLLSKLKTKGDWVAVIKAFGVRNYGTYGSPLYSWMPSTPLDLMSWLRKECSDSLMDEIEAKTAAYGIAL